MKILANVKTWWAAHLTLIAGIVAFFDPSIEHYAQQHPTGTFAAILLLIIGAIKSPASSTTPAAPAAPSSISITKPKT